MPHRTTSLTALSLARRAFIVAVVLGVGTMAACGSESDAPGTGVDSGADGSPQQTFPVNDSGPPVFKFDAGFEEESPPRKCEVPDGFDDCTGRCGPIRNPCTGAIAKQCGGCAGVGDAGGKLICDLETNTCITPKITCADLGAECGRVRNSCGTYLFCPNPATPDVECPAADPVKGTAAQECDPDTKKCKTATSVTCTDLGYECGQAWLGAGPKTNLTDCGDCSGFADRPRCNSVLRVCEPACAAPTTDVARKALCEAAKASRGLECGIISDGCGGTVDCSELGYVCADGETCGFGGIANRCEKFVAPIECQAEGRNCGTIKSVCGGADISCGKCTGTDVCNANGVCGPPCVPKKCADLGSPQCLPSSTPISDGCGGNISDCPVCPGGAAACEPKTDGGVGGTCCVPKFDCSNRPAGIGADACGNQLFDNGCGVKLNCGCSAGSCVNGTCCSPNKCPAAGAVGETCGTQNLGCGATCNRGCTADPQGNSNTCNGGVCCNPEPDSAAEWRTANPGRCQFNIPNGCGGVVDAPCLNGAACIDVAAGPGKLITDPGGTTASAIGFCCTNRNANCNAATSCTTVPDACVTGQTVTCSATACVDAGPTPVCAAGACCAPLACPAAAAEGDTCGTFDRTCGLNCNQVCQPDAQGNANICNGGTCCNPEPDNAGEWRTANTGKCAFNITNGCGGRLDAPCTSGVCASGGVQVVKSGTTFSSGTCCDPAGSCGGAPKAVGDDCVVPNTCITGQTVTCACAGGAACFQNKCCAPSACPGNSPLNGPCGTVDLGCGQNCNRGCSAGTCFQGSCCAPVACPAPSPIGGSCAPFDRGCGQTCNRTCDTSGNKTNNKCQGSTCVCVPTPCPAGFVGSMQNGCGVTVACSGG